jgi:hypothetical protein
MRLVIPGCRDFLSTEIADHRMLNLIRKWLKAGVLENGKWTASEEGTPQGSSIAV